MSEASKGCVLLRGAENTHPGRNVRNILGGSEVVGSEAVGSPLAVVRHLLEALLHWSLGWLSGRRILRAGSWLADRRVAGRSWRLRRWKLQRSWRWSGRPRGRQRHVFLW